MVTNHSVRISINGRKRLRLIGYKRGVTMGCVECGGRGRLYSSMIAKIQDFKMWAYADKFGDKAKLLA